MGVTHESVTWVLQCLFDISLLSAGAVALVWLYRLIMLEDDDKWKH